MIMRLRLLLPIVFLSISNFSFGQSTVLDTANTPYWIDMMQDPNANFFKTQRAFELYWKDRKIEKGSGFKPFKRWEYNTYEIIDDLGNIPKPGQLEKIVENYIKSQYKGGTGSGVILPGVPNSGPATCLTSGSWSELGPRKLSGNRTSQPNGLGRVNALAFHPNDSNMIYAGTPAGGLWVSTDRGNTWYSNTDTLATLGISSIAIDPFDHDTIYIGTGDRDASDASPLGVMRSVDGGKTWTKSNTGMGNAVVGRLIADPNNKGVLLAATSSGIYRSTNHGNNWSRVSTGNYKDIVLHPTNSNLVFAATYSNCKFYRSTNNGATFTNITSGLPTGKRRMSVAVTKDDGDFVYVIVTNSRTYEGLYLSTDKGLTFTRMSNTPNIMDYSTNGSGTGGQAWYDLDIAADPNDKATIYVGGVNIFKSTDSGKTWKINAHWVGSGGAPSIHADQHVMEYDFTNNRLYIGNDGGVYYTDNGGSSYLDVSEGIGNAQIYRLGQSAKTANMVINGYQDNGTGLYENGSWYTIMGGDGMDCVIDPTDDTWAYSDLYYGDVRRFKNGRYNAAIAKNGRNGINESGGWVTPFILQEGTPKTMFIGYKNVWKTTNCQASPPSFTKISNNVAGSNSQNITYLENNPADPKILYVARSGNKFFKTTNVNAGTPTWTDLTSKLPNNAAIYWIESHHKKSNTVWISQSNKVYESNDGGNTWTNISNGLPNLRILSLVYDSSSTREAMYAGTYMGVFYRDTVSKKWEWYNNGMPTYTRVRDLEIYYSPQGRSKSHIVCATYGRGNWRSPLYDEDQKAPVAGFYINDSIGCTGNTFVLTDTSANTPTRWKWEVRPANINYVNGTDSCSQFPQLVFTQAGDYSIKLVAENCIAKDSVEKNLLVSVKQAPKPAQCDGITTSNSQRIGIYEVDIDTFSHSSLGTRDEGGYLDLSCTELIYLKTDTNYNLDIQTGATWNEHVKVFADFNNNGKLDDAGEWIGGSSKGKIHKLNIAIPANAVTNTLIRLRIMSDYDTVTANPCDTLRYGQTQDYGLILELREPKPDFASNLDSVCIGQDLVISDSSEGSILNRKWYFGSDASIDSATGIGPHQISYSTAGYKKIRLVVNDGAAEKSIDSIVFVKASPNLGLALLKGNLADCEGMDLEFSVTDTNQVVAQYSWYKDGNLLKTVSDSFLKITSSALSDSGLYEVRSSNNNCIDTSSQIKIEIFAMPVAGFTVNTDSQCFNLHQFVLGNTSSISLGSNTYSWDFGDANTSATNSPNKTYSAEGLYSIKLIATSDKNCKDSTSKDVRVWPNPQTDFTINSSPQCLKGNGFVLTDATAINSGVYSNQWDFGDASQSSNLSANKTYSNFGNFDIKLISTSDNSCLDSITKTVIVNASPLAEFSINQITQCLNVNSFNFTNTSSIGSGSINKNDWDLGDANTRTSTDVMAYKYANANTYDVKLSVESDMGCSDDTIVKVTVGDSPIADFTSISGSFCLNEHEITFADNSTINSGSISTYAWDFGDATSDANPNPPKKKYGIEGIYPVQLIVNSNNSCADTISKDITIHPSPFADFLAGNTCLGELVNFANQSNISLGTLNYQYTFESGKISALENPSYRYSTAGNKNVELIVTSDQNCKDTLTKTIDIYNLPTANFDYQKTGSNGKNTEMQFTDQSSSDAQNWEWDLDAAGLSSDQNPLVTFSDTGSMMIQLIVENANGCKDTSEKSVFVFPETVFHIVNSFSPNGDLKNDKFELIGLDFVEEYSLKVYSRWGEKVFESDKPSEQWDGTYNGADVPSGFYVFSLEFKDLSGIKYQERGEVFIIR